MPSLAIHVTCEPRSKEEVATADNRANPHPMPVPHLPPGPPRCGAPLISTLSCARKCQPRCRPPSPALNTSPADMRFYPIACSLLAAVSTFLFGYDSVGVFHFAFYEPYMYLICTVRESSALRSLRRASKFILTALLPMSVAFSALARYLAS
jgi:hypothetical protein